MSRAPDYQTAPPQQRGIDWRGLLAMIGPVIGLAFVFALFAALRPSTFLTRDNIEIMMTQTAVVATGSLGMTLIIISGGIDLSVGSAIALVTVVVALMLPHSKVDAAAGAHYITHGYPPLVAALAGVGAGALCGLVVGLLVTRVGLMPFIVTLGMWGAVRGVAKGLAEEKYVHPLDNWLNGLLNPVSLHQRWMLFPTGVWLMLVLAVFVTLLLRYTRFGRHIFAIGSNEQTARLCGVAVERTKTLIYVVAGIFTGIAGVLQCSFLAGGDPVTAKGYELNIIAAVVIGGASLNGGQGSVFGSLIGAVIMTVVANGCTQLEVPNWVQEIVTGGIIVLAVALDRLRQRRT
jgi:ribose/xylose/arabinose/galactoside ABC-type transport system permease subunit